jgi:hypothetical protein
LNTDGAHLSPHPAPLRHELKVHEGFFALFGGPLAWFVQLCAGFALASQPCFDGGERLTVPPVASDWTCPAMISLMAAAIALALVSAWVSWRVFTRTREEADGDHRHLMEAGAGRTRFLALWGLILGAGFAVATVLTGAGFILLPRCAG